MRKPILGAALGAGLGVVDGLSAWATPEARPMILTIVIGSTIKGLLTGAVAGFVARRWSSMTLGIAVGVTVGFALSALAALRQPDHYWEIVGPGMLLGAIVGFATQRYPRSGVRGAAMLVVAAASAAVVLAAQGAPVQADPLQPLALLVGRWEGTVSGQPGTGTTRREFTRVLNGRFIRAVNQTTYEPREPNQRGQTHEDIGYYSVDRALGRAVLRQFHGEGFVNTYVAQPPDRPGVIVFVSTSIENIPPGYRARETYAVIGPDEFEEVFEIAEPGRDFGLYSRARLKRLQ
jgi:hypothetical protein